MKTITIAGAKGGTGKTTTAHALAFEFTVAGYRVTLADCDPQASATQGLGHQPSETPLTAAALRLEFGHGRGGFWLLPGGRSLATASMAQVSDRLVRASDQTDILIIDTPPAIGSIMMAAIGIADIVLVPLQAAPYPMSGLMDILRLADQVNPKARRRAVLTLVKSRRRLSSTIAEAVEAISPGVLHATRIPDDAQCEWAAAACKPIGMFDTRSRAATAYHALANELVIELGLAVHNVGVVLYAAPASAGCRTAHSENQEERHGTE